jgi:outer membrane protein insertion porin family
VRAWIVGLVAIIAAFGVWPTGQAEAQGRGVVIRNIVVEGTRRIDPQTIGTYLKIRVGDRFDQDKLDDSLKALYASGLFRDVSFRREGATLVIRVVENPVINRIAFEGNRKLTDADLRGEINLRPRSVYSRQKIQDAVQRMLAAYRARGRFAATVNPKVIARTQNRVDLVFEIHEGPKTLVQRVSFIGNRTYSDSTLREVVSTKETALWRLLGSSDVYDPAKLKRDQELLKRFYFERGFAEFRVLSAVAELSPDRQGFFITFTVKEGPRYKFGKIKVVTELRRVQLDALRKELKVHEGDRFNAEKIQSSVVALTNVAGNYGYAFVRVVPRTNVNREKRIVDVTFIVQEGPKVFVERIEIIGNFRTRDSVIRREMLVAEGDAFNTTKIRLSRRRLVNLGFFEKVEITNRVGSAPDRMILTVKVEEKATGELSLGAGFSTQDGPLGTVGIREKNFMGRGQDVSLSFLVSFRQTNLNFSFTEPYFLNRNLSAGIDLFRKTRNYTDESNYDTREVGGRLRFGYRITENLKQNWTYSLSHQTITNVPSSASPFIRQEVGSATTSSITMGMVYDTRDNRFDPTDGYVVSVSNTFAGLGGSERFHSVVVKAGYWYSVSPGWVFNVLGESGNIFGIGENVHLQNRFYIGGNNFRGFRFGGIGPRDRLTGDSLGANHYWIVTAEMAFPLGLPKEFGVNGRVFTDVGSAFGIDVSGSRLIDNSSPRVSVGVGISWRSPLGPLRFDVGFPIFKQEGDRTQLINFRFGTRF